MPGRVLGRIVMALLIVIAALVAAVVALDTAPGHALIVRLAGGFKPENGLRYAIGRIDGSIYGRMTIRDLVVRDPVGVVATVPAVTIDWHPGSLIHNKLSADTVEAALVTVAKRPALLPTPPSPLLPDIDIFVGRFAVERLVLEAPVTGSRQELTVNGNADIAAGRAKVAADVTATTAGDRLRVRLDAVPADDRFDIDAHLVAPAGGVVDGFARLGKPLAVDVTGTGTWAAWTGRAAASVAGAPLADLALTARGGRFTAKGTARPGLIVPAAARLTAPALTIDASATAVERVVDADVRLISRALDVSARGRVDLAANRFGGVRVDARLLAPAALLADVRGRDVRLALTLDGPFATPTIDYRLTAAALGFGTTGVERLNAAGIATVDAARIRLPVHATAGRITGLDPSVGSLLENIALDGDVRIDAKTVASDNLRLRSRAIDATVVAAASLKTGSYTAALKGRINRYAVAGVGVVDLVTDARIVPDARGRLTLRGTVRATTVAIDNPAVRDFLGGNAVASAAVARSPDGLITATGLSVVAPKLRITDGQGSYRPDGTIALSAAGSQAQYGPFGVAVSGTIAKPTVVLRAKRPNVGVQLTDVEATLRPAPGGYAVVARGGSPYGPFTADVGLGVGAGPLTIDVRRAALAGLIATGKVAATAAGPYVGTLALTGPGLTGTARLSGEGAVQRADLAATAANARIPLPEPVTIEAGTATATVMLLPNAPRINGSGSFTGIRQGTLTIAHAKGQGAYHDGQGLFNVTADGTSGVPFAVALNGVVAPKVIRVGGTGSINAVALRLAAPAEIDIVPGGYRLQPTMLVLPSGSVVVAGTSGATTRLDATLTAVDLRIVEAFKPGLGLSGKASGTLAFALPPQGGVPTAHATLGIAGFARAGVSAVSTPTDIALLADLTASGGTASAVLRRSGTVLGRMQAQLAPLPTAGAWSDRLLAAPLSGGVRFNGPAELLWALAGVRGQELSGPLAIGADFAGRLSAPQIRGVVRGKGLRYANTAYGTVIDQIDLDSRFVDTRLEITRLTGRAGTGGTVTATGYADLAVDKGLPIDIKVKLAKARLAQSKAIEATATGDLAITNNSENGAQIAGDIEIERARYVILRPAAAEVTELDGVRRKNAPPPAAAPPPAPLSRFQLAVKVHAPNEIFVQGLGLEAEWRTELTIRGSTDAPRITGSVDLIRGTYGFAGRSFALERGQIRFNGEVPPNPGIDIEATTSVDGLTAIIDITGRAFNPEIAFSSTPALAQDEILSRLLFGGSIETLSPTQALQLAASLNTLRGSSGGGFNPLGSLRKATGIDRLRILGGDEKTGQGTSVAAGKYLTNNIYVEVATDSRGYTVTQIEIALTRTLRLLSSISTFGTSNVALRYSRNY